MSNGDYDVFGAHFGLGLPIALFDATAIEALLTGALTSGSQIDQLVVGWDGETEDAWQVIRALLRAKGYFPGYTAQGLINFARARFANVLDIDGVTTVTPVPDQLELMPSDGDGIDRVVATFGATPWYDGDTVEVNVLSDSDALEPPNSLRAGIFADSNSVELDMRAIGPPSLDDASFELVSYVSMRGLNLKTLFVRVNDPGTVDAGDIVKLGDPGLRSTWFVDSEGSRIDVDDSARWYGQVLGFKRNLVDGSLDLELKLNPNDFARLRAPSAVVASVASAVYTCDENNFGGALGGGTDVEQFTVGDMVEVWSEDGVRVSGTAVSPDVQEVTAIGTNTLTLDAAFTTPPTAGDIIRISHLSTADGYPEDGVGSVGWDLGTAQAAATVTGVVPFVFGADASAELGPNDDEAHIYGYGSL